MLKAGSFINAEAASKKLDSARIRLESWLNDIQTKLNGTWDLTNGPKMTCDGAIRFSGLGVCSVGFVGDLLVGRVGSLGIWEYVGPP